MYKSDEESEYLMSNPHRLEQERKQAAKQQEANSSEPKPKKEKKRKRDAADESIADTSSDAASAKSKAVGHGFFLTTRSFEILAER
jgi:hypothetical protein